MQKCEFGKSRQNLATFSCRCLIPAKMAGFQLETSGSGPINGRIRPDPAGYRPFWPDPTRAGRIPAIFWPESGPPAGYRRPDVVGLRRRLDSNDRQLLNSENWISNVCVRIKSFPKIKEAFTVKLKMIFVDH